MKTILIILFSTISYSQEIVEIGKFIANDGRNGANFGKSVEINDTLIVQLGDNSNGNEYGKDEAYVGLGFAEIKLYDHANSYTHFITGLNLSDNTYNDDFNMMLCLLDYSHNKNYSTAVSKELALLASNTFSFHFDSSIYENDIRKTFAKPYYNLNDYTNALAQAKILDATITIEESDDDFELLLATELNRLSGEFHSKF